MGASSASAAVDGINPPSGRPQHRGRRQEAAKRSAAAKADDAYSGALRAPFADETLGDGAAVTAFFRDQDPGAQIEQDASPAEDREQGEHQAHQGRVDAEVGRQAGAYPCDNAALAHPVQALGSVAAWFVHG